MKTKTNTPVKTYSFKHGYALHQFTSYDTEPNPKTDAYSDDYIYRMVNKHGDVMNLHGASLTCWVLSHKSKRKCFNAAKLINSLTGLGEVIQTETPPNMTVQRGQGESAIYMITALNSSPDNGFITGIEGYKLTDSALYIGESKHHLTRLATHRREFLKGNKPSNWYEAIPRHAVHTLNMGVLLFLPELDCFTSDDMSRLRKMCETFYITLWSSDRFTSDKSKHGDVSFDDCELWLHDLNKDKTSISFANAFTLNILLSRYIAALPQSRSKTHSELKLIKHWWTNIEYSN